MVAKLKYFIPELNTWGTGMRDTFQNSLSTHAPYVLFHADGDMIWSVVYIISKIELKTADCNKTVMNNRGFIDPGFWVFKGRTTSSTTTTTSSATVSTSAVPSAAVTVSASSVIATSSTIVFRSTATCTSTSSVPCTVTVVPDVHTVISVIFCRVTILTFPLSFRLHFLLNYHRLHLYQFKRFLLEIFAYAIRLTRPSHTSVKLVIAAPLSAWKPPLRSLAKRQVWSYNLWHFRQFRNNRVNWKHTFGGCVSA